ncbi:Glycosyl transferase, group 1 [uncultured Paludibacter sp.]|nr:Glycosyl transferase, group 1 [uncultured Paludibacter sp.]
MNRKKIRVAFFADMLERDVDGAVRTMYQLIDRIPEDKFEFLFFCGAPPKTELKHKIAKVPSVFIPFNATYKTALPYLKSMILAKSLWEFNPEVIHIATPSSLGFFALNYAQKNAVPVLSIYHTHFISYIQYYFKPFPFLISAAESLVAKKYRDFYNQCDIVYTPTNQMINELSNIGVSKRYLKLWQRGLDMKLFHPSKKDADFIQNITGNNKPCVLFASRLVWEKNLETLFNIYDEAEARQLDVNFIIAGNGVAEETARQRMKNAFFLGHINHNTLAKVYASSDVLVFPSVSETYGNVVVEAMASGCVPVIAKGGGSQSLVKDGETGFLCEPNNAKEYVEKIQQLLHHSEQKEKMQQAGFQYTSKLSWENLANEYFNDMEYLSQFAPAKSTVFSLRDFFPSKSPSKRLVANSL